MKGRYRLDTESWEWVTSPRAKTFKTRGKKIRKRGYGTTSTIGLTAIVAGRDAIIIDRMALSDPLLARLPPKSFDKMGHFQREVPEGYKHARLTNELDQMNPHLREYYRPLRTIIQGPLFSWDRIAEIYRFNRGYYDHHLDEYCKFRSRQPGRWAIGTEPAEETEPEEE